MFDGAQLHSHVDPNVDNLIHTRFNVYIKIPDEGGYPVYNGKVYRLKERTYLCCRAGIEPHYCQKVKGDRIIISYGFLIPYNEISNINYIYQLDIKYILKKKIMEYIIKNTHLKSNIIDIYYNFFDNCKIITQKIEKFSNLNINLLTNIINIIKNDEKINSNDLTNELKKYDFLYSLNGISTKLIRKCKLFNSTNDENIYIFEDIKDKNDKINTVKKYLTYPCDIPDIRVNRFYYGNKNTGTHLHNHSPALNYLFSGIKLWLIIEYEKTNLCYLKLNNYFYDINYAKKNNIDILNWFIDNCIKIKNDIDNSYIIIQKSNEIIYIPNNYFHAVLNLSSTCGITISWN